MNDVTRPPSPVHRGARRPPRPAARRWAGALLAGAAAGALLTACQFGPDGDPVAQRGRTAPTSAAPDRVAARPAAVEELAKAMGCTAKITNEVADYRQASCAHGEARYQFLSFTTDDGKRAWLEAAKEYGGVYLVGNRWALSTEPKEDLATARNRLGGTIEGDPSAHSGH